jgi:50S ribosomal subunit-associated GTPase HflX
LAKTAGATAVGHVMHRARHTNSALISDQGKLAELKIAVLQSNVNMLIFDD